MNKKLLWLLFFWALFLLVVLLTKQAKALFTAEVTIKNNLLRSGKIAIVVSPQEAVLTADSLLPGQTTSGSFELKNSGSQSVVATISAKKSAGYKDLYEALELTIIHQGQVLYQGLLTNVQGISLTPSPLTPTATDSFELRATLPASTDKKAAELYANVSFTIEATQARM